MILLLNFKNTGLGNGTGTSRPTSGSGRSFALRATPTSHRRNTYTSRENDPGPTQSFYSAYAQVFYRYFHFFIHLIQLIDDTNFKSGRGKPGWGKESTRPPWWPGEVPWANVRMDARPEDDKQRVKIPFFYFDSGNLIFQRFN